MALDLETDNDLVAGKSVNIKVSATFIKSHGLLRCTPAVSEHSRLQCRQTGCSPSFTPCFRQCNDHFQACSYCKWYTAHCHLHFWVFVSYHISWIFSCVWYNSFQCSHSQFSCSQSFLHYTFWWCNYRSSKHPSETCHCKESCENAAWDIKCTTVRSSWSLKFYYSTDSRILCSQEWCQKNPEGSAAEFKACFDNLPLDKLKVCQSIIAFKWMIKSNIPFLEIWRPFSSKTGSGG